MRDGPGVKISEDAKDVVCCSFLRKPGLNGFIGKDPEFLNVLSKLPILAKTDTTILITGETGVGKELAARGLHYLSQRASKPFIPVNCGALPSTLVENELFGHQRGAFTDARTNKKGLLAEAEGGTLFLDEMEALSLESQSVLLRLLQQKTYRPLGSNQNLRANIRIIGATNVNLKQQARKGQFRSDLFYRFAISVEIPPLRERKTDIPLLADHYLEKYCREFNMTPKWLSADARAKLMWYDWPGNVRELENTIQEAILFSQGEKITSDDICLDSTATDVSGLSFVEAKRRMVEEFEKNYLIQLLIRCHGNISKAAKCARKDRADLSRLIRKHNIDATAFKNHSSI